jgi:hypothetical protein
MIDLIFQLNLDTHNFYLYTISHIPFKIKFGHFSSTPVFVPQLKYYYELYGRDAKNIGIFLVINYMVK